MDFKEYQEKARKTAVYGDAGLLYTILGLSGEAGEVSEIVKKKMRKVGSSTFNLGQDEINAIASELGDVLWYVANCCFELGIDMDKIAKQNIVKLEKRKKKGELTER